MCIQSGVTGNSVAREFCRATEFPISLSLQKVRNFAHFLGIFKYRAVHHEILNSFEYSLFACRHRLIKYAPAVSDVVYRHLEVVVGALKKTHIFTLCT